MEEHMPKVVQLMKKRRAAGEGAHLNECWRRGVLGREAGWFYAAEGPLAVGVPEGHLLADPQLVAMRRDFPESALLLLKPPPGQQPTGA